MNNRILIYTSITGGYEQPRNDIRVETKDLFRDPRRSARQHKCLIPDFWEYDYSIWVDGNTSLEVTPGELIAELGDADILVYKHWRDCIYDEAYSLPKSKTIDDQMCRYKSFGYPEKNGLAATTYLIRRHNFAVEMFNNMWWSEICRGSERDQLSFNYVAWRLKDSIKIKYFKESHIDIHKNNTKFKYKKHNEI